MLRNQLAIRLQPTPQAASCVLDLTNGAIPEQATAIQVGEILLISAFGKDLIEKEEPFHTYLQDNIWTVSGTLPAGTTIGGTAVIKFKI